MTQVVASPGSGIENPGDVITLTVDLSKAVTVTGTPTLSLNDGATATYTGGSGTNTLTFSYTVGAADSTVPTLAITQANWCRAGRPSCWTKPATLPIFRAP